MPITHFSSFEDGLCPEKRARGHFVAHNDLNDERFWIPYAPGVWVRPCCFNLTAGGFSVLLKGLPGAALGVHYHVGTVRGYTLQGHWRNLRRGASLSRGSARCRCTDSFRLCYRSLEHCNPRPRSVRPASEAAVIDPCAIPAGWPQPASDARLEGPDTCPPAGRR